VGAENLRRDIRKSPQYRHMTRTVRHRLTTLVVSWGDNYE
jgi:hypothetical protein